MRNHKTLGCVRAEAGASGLRLSFAGELRPRPSKACLEPGAWAPQGGKQLRPTAGSNVTSSVHPLGTLRNSVVGQPLWWGPARLPGACRPHRAQAAHTHTAQSRGRAGQKAGGAACHVPSRGCQPRPPVRVSRGRPEPPCHARVHSPLRPALLAPGPGVATLPRLCSVLSIPN